LDPTSSDIEFVRLVPGDCVLVELPHSEVCMHMRVAGSAREVELLQEQRSGLAMAQILDRDGGPCGGPVTPGEAGIYSDGRGFYAYALREEAELNRRPVDRGGASTEAP
jgi:hypothetical protein